MTSHAVFTIEFNDHRARAISVSPQEPPARTLAALDVPSYAGVVIVHGGAGAMDDAEMSAARAFIDAALIPLAEERRLLVADGATDAGVVRALGEARAAARATFPLVGVAPHALVVYPGHPARDADAVPLGPSHTHFVFVEGKSFGVESELLVGLLRASGKPGFALVINGGQIVLKEAHAHARQGNPIVVVRGSGRIADKLADLTSDERTALPPQTRLFVCDIDRPEVFRALAQRLLRLAP